MAKPTKQAQEFHFSKKPKAKKTAAKAKQPQKVRDDDKDAARVRNRIEEIMEQREFEREFDL